MLTIHYADGRIQEGVLIRLQGDSLRVFVQDADDTVDFSLVNGTWLSEDRDPVNFRFPLAAFEAAGLMPNPGWTLNCEQELNPPIHAVIN